MDIKIPGKSNGSRVPLEASGSQLSYEKAARQLAERQMAQCSHEAAELFETSISWLFSKVEVLTYVWQCTFQKMYQF